MSTQQTALDFRRRRQRLGRDRLIHRGAHGLETRSSRLQGCQDFRFLRFRQISAVQLREQFCNACADTSRFGIDGRECGLEIFEFGHDVSPERGERRLNVAGTTDDLVSDGRLEHSVDRVTNRSAHDRVEFPIEQHAEILACTTNISVTRFSYAVFVVNAGGL